MQEPENSATAPARQLDPAQLQALTERVDALAEVPAGPELAAALAAIDSDHLTGEALVELMVALNRQSNHARGELLAMMGRVLLDDVPGRAQVSLDPAVAAVDEVRAALRLTRTAAGHFCHLAWDLYERLPQVLAAMRSGVLDQPRARVLSSWTADLTDQHADAVVQALLPRAPEMTTGELIDAVAKTAIALDPQWVRRRYEQALLRRRVVGRRNPDGTATLSGYELPLDEVADACARLDDLAKAAKAAGHPDRLDHLRADLLVGRATFQVVPCSHDHHHHRP